MIQLAKILSRQPAQLDEPIKVTAFGLADDCQEPSTNSRALAPHRDESSL
jgi:hypothetical protein